MQFQWMLILDGARRITLEQLRDYEYVAYYECREPTAAWVAIVHRDTETVVAEREGVFDYQDDAKEWCEQTVMQLLDTL